MKYIILLKISHLSLSSVTHLQHSFSPTHSFSLFLSQLQISFSHHVVQPISNALSLYLFSLHPIALSLDRRFKGLLIGLNLGFVWNFWVSRWLFVGHFWVCGFSVAGSVMVAVGVYLNRWLDRWWLLLVFVWIDIKLVVVFVCLFESVFVLMVAVWSFGVEWFEFRCWIDGLLVGLGVGFSGFGEWWWWVARCGFGKWWWWAVEGFFWDLVFVVDGDGVCFFVVVSAMVVGTR